MYGNIDGPDVRSELPEIDVVQLVNFPIGVDQRAEGGPPLAIEQRKFQEVQVIIHRHNHRTENVKREHIPWFNLGSATGKFPIPKKPYEVLTVGSEVQGEIIEL